MGRIQGLTDTLALTGSQLIKSVEGYIFSVTVAWDNAAVGDKVYFRDGSDGTAPIRLVVALATANGTVQMEWFNGVKFDNGIYYDEGTPANAYVQIQYK